MTQGEVTKDRERKVKGKNGLKCAGRLSVHK